MASLKLTCVLVLMCMALVGAPIAHAITCGQVTRDLSPCLSYLLRGGAVLPSCCGGIRHILSMARSTEDRRGACKCLKAIAGEIHGLNQSNAESLPIKCGLNIPYKISTSTNCDSIN